jgi:hypothetical protein
MERIIIVGLLACIGCTSAGTPVSEFTDNGGTPYTPSHLDASTPDTSPDVASVALADVEAPYLPCVTSKLEATEYPRLAAKYCTDSTGNTYLDSYLDNKLGITCNWDTGTDDQTRCLPNDWQESPMYTDDSCLQPLVFLPDGPLPRYMGIMSEAQPDSGQTGMLLVIYNLGNIWSPTDMGLVWNMQTNPSGTFECEAFNAPLYDIQYVELGSVVSPSIFQLQK